MIIDNFQNAKVVKFNKDNQNLYDIANEKLSQGELGEGLKYLIEIEKSGKFNVTIYKDIADTFTGLKMYGQSINYWYKYLNAVSKRHLVEAYNGLGANYYLLGYDELALYYFEKQLSDKYDKELPFDNYMYDLFYKEEQKSKKPSIHIVDKQGELDSVKLARARNIYEQDREKSLALLKEIQPNSSRYTDALIFLSVDKLINKEYTEGIEMFKTIENLHKNNVYAINNLFGCYTVIDDHEKAQRYYELIKKHNNFDFKLLFKYASNLTESGDYQKALEFATKLYDNFHATDHDISFVYAICLFNVKQFEKASRFFYEHFIASRSCVSEFYYGLCLNCIQNSTSFKPLKMSFLFDGQIVKKMFTFADALLNFSVKELKRDETEVIKFCNDALFTDRFDLQVIACQLVATTNTNKSKKYLKGLLLESDVSDSLKMIIISLLVNLGNDKLTGVVFNHVYTQIQFEKVEFNEKKADLFMDAYALAFGRLSSIEPENLYKIKISAYDIYYKLISNGNVRKVKDVIALGAVIALYCNFEFCQDKEYLYEYFSTDEKSVNKIISLIDLKT